jgi:hypothetical protein
MSGIEDRLRAALREAADARPVDVMRMREELNDRLGPPSRRPRKLAALVAAVVLVGGALVGVQALRDDGNGRTVEPADGVDPRFSCAHTSHIDLSGAQDEFVPDLVGRTPTEVAREYDAPRWEFVESGDTARLRLGNEDGTLGSETRYVREDGEWRMRSSVVCDNGTPAAPMAAPLALGLHGNEPWPARGALSVGEAGTASVLVDDRPVYDYSGLVNRHRSIYLAPCETRLCFAVGQPDSVVVDRMQTREVGVLGTMCSFFQPDDLVGRTSPYALLVAWDTHGRTTDFSVSGPGGTYGGTAFTDKTWGPLKVWLALVPNGGPDVSYVGRLHDANGLVDEYAGPVACD